MDFKQYKGDMIFYLLFVYYFDLFIYDDLLFSSYFQPLSFNLSSIFFFTDALLKNSNSDKSKNIIEYELDNQI